jgi:ABC-2 type transport system permease protein
VNRIAALLAKELVDLRQNPGVFVPALLVGLGTTALPFVVAILIPVLTGEPLTQSGDLRGVLEMWSTEPLARELSPEGALQAFLFQQFLIFVVGLTPVMGSMAAAAQSIVGEKQARTLEPLLATPLRTAELLASKVLSAAALGGAITVLCFALYAAGVLFLAEPGVAGILFTPASLLLAFVLCPLVMLVALQLAVCASARANDARGAQQIAALVVLPLTGMMVAQLFGVLLLTPVFLLGAVAVLVALNAILLRIAVALFDRETILTRWR